jgi:hypothetical protein
VASAPRQRAYEYWTTDALDEVVCIASSLSSLNVIQIIARYTSLLPATPLDRLRPTPVPSKPRPFLKLLVSIPPVLEPPPTIPQRPRLLFPIVPLPLLIPQRIDDLLQVLERARGSLVRTPRRDKRRFELDLGRRRSGALLTVKARDGQSSVATASEEGAVRMPHISSDFFPSFILSA